MNLTPKIITALVGTAVVTALEQHPVQERELQVQEQAAVGTEQAVERAAAGMEQVQELVVVDRGSEQAAVGTGSVQAAADKHPA